MDISPQSFLQDPLLNTSQAIILTPNQRLASWLQSRYGDIQQNSGQLVWQPLSIYPWQRWLQQLWQELLLAAPSNQVEQITSLLAVSVLSPWQEQILWQQIIASAGHQFLDEHATVAAVQQAYQLLVQWQVDCSTVDWHDAEDQQAFRQWLLLFQEKCTQAQWITQMALPDQLLKLDLTHQLRDLQRIYSYGFDFISKQQAWFLRELQQKYNIQWLPVENFQTYQVDNDLGSNGANGSRIEVKCQGFQNEMAEWHAAVNWAYQCQQHYSQRLQHDDLEGYNQEKRCRIGIVVPELDRKRVLLQHWWCQHWDVKALTGFVERPWAKQLNFSGGEKLSQAAMWQTALTIFHLLGFATIKRDDFSYLLRSLYIAGSHDELMQRAEVDRRWRESGATQIELKVCYQWLRLQCWQGAVIAQQFLSSLHTLLADVKVKCLNAKTQPLENWVQYLLQALDIFGWPGERTLTSDEYQTWCKCQEFIHQFTQLTYLLGDISLQKVLDLLRHFSNQMIVQPQDSAQASIHVLGLLEASGQQFDYLWVMGMHNEYWPQPLRPNPFLPLQLQRQLAMPRACPERELEIAKQVVAAFANAAEEVMFSWPKTRDDQTLEPSPVIKHLPMIAVTHLYSVLQPMAKVALMTRYETHGPEVSDLKLQGGSDVVKQQSACPFQAFARYRLASQSLQEVTYGITPLQKGVVVHRMLEHFWQLCRDQARLCSFTLKELQQLATNSVVHAIQFLDELPLKSIAMELVTLEQERLIALLLKWLEYEKQRLPFEVVALEKKSILQWRGYYSELRVDRIDRLSDGQLLVLDYKTGLVAVSHWQGKRMREPQLPLYCMLVDEPVSAVAFAQVNRNHTQFKGCFAEDAKVLSKNHRGWERSEDWDEMMLGWKHSMAELLSQYVQGLAVVDPRDNQVCRVCPQRRLCRIDDVAQTFSCTAD